MRPSYRATFKVGQQGGTGSEELLARIAGDVLSWACSRREFKTPKGLRARLLETNERAEIAAGASLETIGTERDGQRLWGLRLIHADEGAPGIQWHADVCLALRDDEPLVFSCTSGYGAVGGTYVGRPRAATRPRIVRDVLKAHGGHAGLPLETVPRTVKPDEVGAFVSVLVDPERRRPLVFLSATNFTDRPVVGAGPIADQLAGIAHVVTAANRFVSFKLADRLPKRLNSWDGFIRVYMPGLTLADTPFRHAHWSPDDVRKHERRRKKSFAAALLAELAEASALAMPADHLQWQELESVLRRRAFNELQERGELDEVIQLAELEVEELKGQLKAGEERQRQLAQDLAESRAREESWRQAYLELQKGEKSPAESEITLPVRSVQEAVERATESYSERLLFHFNGRSDVETNPFDTPEEVMAALDWLGTTYYLARTGKRACKDFDVSIRTACEWFHRSHQSKTTMKKYRRWYTTKIGDETIWLGEHVGTGSGKDARHTIRIAYYWDSGRGRVVVGYIGQHQETDAT